MAACACPTCGHGLPLDLFAIDREARLVVANGRFAALTENEFEIFITLWDAPGRVHSKEALLRAMAPLIDDEPEIKIVDVMICKIRKKVATLGLAIETQWGAGYRMLPRGVAAA
ncbi:winged helix-turn-helix domain-containing protein [Rhizobium ruizarguesonis]